MKKTMCLFEIEQEIQIQKWVRKINSKPIEYVDKINPQSIKSVKQRLKNETKKN